MLCSQGLGFRLLPCSAVEEYLYGAIKTEVIMRQCWVQPWLCDLDHFSTCYLLIFCSHFSLHISIAYSKAEFEQTADTAEPDIGLVF